MGHHPAAKYSATRFPERDVSASFTASPDVDRRGGREEMASVEDDMKRRFKEERWHRVVVDDILPLRVDRNMKPSGSNKGAMVYSSGVEDDVTLSLV
mmetsp:Transcript_41029/g.59972  ORF Transcript_41029/g.59972 Transcript_41029/m.59972 type:complete len:97 (-) Transcript_41029:17-307(-)